MSKARYFGSQVDVAYQSMGRMPAFKVYIWNPNRATIQDVVLGRPACPRYDITDWVISVDYSENICWENNDDGSASNCKLQVQYDAHASPIEITERTIQNDTPIQIWQGDERVPEDLWVLIFTGLIRGNPGMVEMSRDGSSRQVLSVTAVGREEPYLNSVVTARGYTKGDDIGQVVVETAIEFMHLDRREIDIGEQGYVVGHSQSQMVDIEVLKGIYQVLSCVGKKPKFNFEGRLVAADTDLNKPATREYPNMDLIQTIRRVQGGASMNNCVRLLGLDSALTDVVERKRRLAHGTITAGFFCQKVKEKIYFSEDKGKETGGRKAYNTTMWDSFEGMGVLMGEHAHWHPQYEPDGKTCFGGTLVFDTGFDPTLRTWILVEYSALMIAAAAALIAGLTVLAGGLLEAANFSMIGILLTFMSMGKVEYAISGEPVTKVYQQLCSTAQLHGLLSVDIREIEIQNEWLYDIDYMGVRVLELLRRELVKSWTYEIEMADDPLLEVDDVISLPGYKFYITSISKRLSRDEVPSGLMQITAWRIAPSPLVVIPTTSTTTSTTSSTTSTSTTSSTTTQSTSSTTVSTVSTSSHITTIPA